VRAGVVGQGSIGRRHARILARMGLEVAAASTRVESAPTGGASTEARATDADGRVPVVARDVAGLVAAHRPDYVVIASVTSRHGGDLAALATAGFGGRVLVEKPLLATEAPLPDARFAAAGVGYNLRHHPLVREARRRIPSLGPLTAAEFDCGQHLAEWRPGVDLRTTSSARRDLGGGVLRDLSHELDLALVLCGDWHGVAAATGRVGGLGIETEDTASLVVRTAGCASVRITLDYLRPERTRRFVLRGASGALECDLVAGELRHDGDAVRAHPGPDDTYAAEHRAMLDRNGEGVCTFAEAMRVVRLVDAAERAAAMQRWVAA
jgi:predicted dehydrogenase